MLNRPIQALGVQNRCNTACQCRYLVAGSNPLKTVHQQLGCELGHLIQ